ncbi:MAG: hypothetical protein CVU92_05410 [Firmicutes bacterium HGW-Firmicutes-17]|jgi:hypothetical protein|nr:MAG: hypothetical protein CVU92_05410 [Firmicutes bacterium HGW-Firmicutes-17]
MIYITVDGNNLVKFQHFLPVDEVHGLGKTEEELLIEGYLVDSIPQPEQQAGKVPILYYTPETNVFHYEYNDIPKTPEQIQAEKIVSIENQTAEAMVDIDFRLSNIELGL